VTNQPAFSHKYTRRSLKSAHHEVLCRIPKKTKKTKKRKTKERKKEDERRMREAKERKKDRVSCS
jgi:transposase